LLALLALGLPGSGHAWTDTLRWIDSSPDPSPVAGFSVHLGPDSRNYRPYMWHQDVGMAGAQVDAPEGDGVRCVRVTVPDDVSFYYVAIKSYTQLDGDWRQESGFSNEQLRLPGVGASSCTATDAEGIIAVTPVSVAFKQEDSPPPADEPSGGDSPPPADEPSGENSLPPAGGSSGQDFFAPAQFDVEVQWVAANLDTPVYLTAPRGDPRLFVLEAGGRIRIIDNGKVLPVPFLDLSFDTPETAEEGGLLGLAFDPAYARNGRFYVYRTDVHGDSVLSRFQVSEDPSVADVWSEVELLRVAQPYEAQNGGSIAFGPDDGFLYLGLGDGGSVDDPGNRAQDGGELLGKLLRLDVGVPPAGDSIPTGNGYAIPADNPFVDDPGVRDEIWALGLRNPYRFSFDRKLSELWLTDEGQDHREEVNFEARDDAGGRNYGWDVMEGSLCNPDDPAPAPPCGAPSLVPPLHEYPHTNGNCAITGGYVYRGTLAELQGQYFFGDYCSGGVWSLDRTSEQATDWTEALGAAVAGVPLQLISFGEGGAGDLYIVHRNGNIFRFGLPDPIAKRRLDRRQRRLDRLDRRQRLLDRRQSRRERRE
jgi:glucose/arabinose dehydrogenase